ncbi:MAG: M23 family metallopeptidase [Bryobacteraceae bacterium]|nr:M23 family metallopeptidase [Bryobacteraceae bacterium]
MNQPYFIVVLAHSLHGRIRRIHVPYQAVYVVLALAMLGAASLFGFVGSYVRMALKVSNYNSLRHEFDTLRSRYRQLEKESEKTEGQLAQLQTFASEVSLAFGLQQAADAGPDLGAEGRLVPSFHESLNEYTLLRNAGYTQFRQSYTRRYLTNTRPSLWPVNGRLLSHWGRRDDPFRGFGAFHSGVDLSAATGTPVRATADGIVQFGAWFGAYGKVIILDHGDGLETYYAHLSRIDVVEGQEVRMGEVIGASGATGRVTSPHLHYEVRSHGTPVNPYPYLARSGYVETARRKDFPF